MVSDARKPIFDSIEGRGLRIFVNYFTCYLRPMRLLSYAYICDKACYLRRVPHRTIRRVHVMPSSTSMFRIGYARLFSSGGEDNDITGDVGRR
jgi:hypothetical protein